MSESEYVAFVQIVRNNQPLMQAYRELFEACRNNRPTSEKQELYNRFREQLYSNADFREKVLNAMNQNHNYFDPTLEGNLDQNQFFQDHATWGTGSSAFNREFQYYVRLWEQIHAAGGCETIDEQYQTGDEGTEWFNNMVTAGLVSIYMLDSGNEDNDWEVTTIATSVGRNYLQEVSDEEKAKKAEVEYEHEMKIINRKDTKFDTALKKLETEEQACKTELDSLKKIKDENIEKTFNIFS